MTYIVKQNYSLTVTGSKQLTVNKNMTHTIGGELHSTINGLAEVTACKSVNLKIGDALSLNVSDDIIASSLSGNIQLVTQGRFPLFDANNNVTGEGYNNLGTRGNIKIVSTLGNIGVYTVENTKIGTLNKPYACVPWNPSFLRQLRIVAQIFNNLR